jgi:uncharacterized protein
MATISAPTRPAPPRSARTRSDLQEADLEGRPQSPTTLNWGNSAPLALAAFAVTTFMLSMTNANLISPAVKPVVFAVALMFGGLTQVIASYGLATPSPAFCSLALAASGCLSSPWRSGS